MFLDDHSRIKLHRSGIDYINASLVIAEEADRAYILTQVMYLVLVRYEPGPVVCLPLTRNFLAAL